MNAQNPIKKFVTKKVIKEIKNSRDAWRKKKYANFALWEDIKKKHRL